MRRVVITWSVAFAVLIGAFAITVATVNNTLYSAGGFVGSYLNALSHKDAATALQLPGVLASEDSAADLLTDAALGDISDITLEDDDTDSDGIHTVTYSYTIGDQQAETDFQVRKTGNFLGLFPTWSFDTSPLATVAVTVLHDDRFRANGVNLTAAAQPTESGGFLVFTPGIYSFDHSSTYLTADAITAPITEPGSVTTVQVNVQANAAFVAELNTRVRDFLDTCATQQVLLPTSCPFGKTFDNRIDTTPAWSMSVYPQVDIIPGDGVGSWVMPQAGAAAHLSVEVRSLYDGSRTQFDEDIPFAVAYGITIGDNDLLAIRALG
ncbi:MAG: hypothetical protein JWQ43_1569 [Glaciihabitans sp.]|nr:hypothetical protein [Glaciihabitans sp.]